MFKQSKNSSAKIVDCVLIILVSALTLIGMLIFKIDSKYFGFITIVTIFYFWACTRFFIINLKNKDKKFRNIGTITAIIIATIVFSLIYYTNKTTILESFYWEGRGNRGIYHLFLGSIAAIISAGFNHFIVTKIIYKRNLKSRNKKTYS